MAAVNLSPNERLFVSGRTGSGKTTLVRYLLRSVPRYAVLDAKHTYRSGNVPIVASYDEKLDQQIIRVPWDEEPEGWDDAIEAIWAEGNRLIYVDEATLILPARAARHPLAKAIRTGRERGVGVWTGTQRPKEIPSYVFTEAEHILSFRLQWEADRKKVIEYSGDDMEAILASVRGHDAAYYDVLHDRALLLRPRLVRSTDNAGTGRLLRNRDGRTGGNRVSENGSDEYSAQATTRAGNVRGGSIRWSWLNRLKAQHGSDRRKSAARPLAT